MEYIFYLGIVWVIVTWIIGLSKAKVYDLNNQKANAKVQRLLCISYTAGFLILSLGCYYFFADKNWLYWIILIGSAMMGFGALQEARKEFPNAPRNYTGE